MTNEFDELLDSVLTEGDDPPAASPSVSAEPEAPENPSTRRRGVKRLAERQCPRWMHHRPETYCKTCGETW